MAINRQSIQETTGNSDNVAQSFKQNIFFDAAEAITLPFVFEVPKYTTAGGTVNYYSQEPNAIFTSLIAPFIRFDFSANTSSFGPSTFIKHDIYRVSWDLFSAIQSGLKANADDAIQTDNFTTETIEEFDESTGNFTRKTITRTKNDIQNIIKSSRKPTDRQSTRMMNSIIKPTVADLQDQLDSPILSITASTTGITTNIYDFRLDQFIKNLGNFKTELFQDRDQYIVDTNFIFEMDVTSGLTDYQLVNPIDGSVSDGSYKSSVTTQTTSDRQTIQSGEFQGIQFAGGAYFSYFNVPDKPILEYPSATGQTNTFTPEIFWTNGENADEYLVQVNYSTGDTGFTGTVFSYIVPKSDDFKENAVSKTKGPDTEFTTSKAIRKYQLSLKSNKCLLYRVGNVKNIINIFGVKQNVVTFSDYNSMCTQFEPIRTFVYTESDSPYSREITGPQTPPSLESESPLTERSLSGVVSGSTVTGATMQLVYPNSSFVTTTTNSVGEFYFTELEDGNYTLNTTYRGYALDSRSITINSDTSVFIDLQIRWDNIYDIWAVKENDIIKY
ncbi:MAG: carboxypeptidase-like regulatory domain-containing protein [Nanoarchaeota archaeon]